VVRGVVVRYGGKLLRVYPALAANDQSPQGFLGLRIAAGTGVLSLRYLTLLPGTWPEASSCRRYPHGAWSRRHCRSDIVPSGGRYDLSMHPGRALAAF
jgi:hypothetical protein